MNASPRRSQASPKAGRRSRLKPSRCSLSSGVRCTGIHAPNAGGVQRDPSLMTCWAAAKHNVLLVEFLIGLGTVPEKGAWFLFAPIKMEGIRSGPGRALVRQP